MPETRKLAAILAADVAGYSKLAGADEEQTLARLRALRSDRFDPTIALHHGRVVKRTGDGVLIEFRSVVDVVRCAIEVQNGMVERNAGLPRERRIEFRVGIHLGDVVEESDGDLMGDGLNIAARLEGITDPGRYLPVGGCLPPFSPLLSPLPPSPSPPLPPFPLPPSLPLLPPPPRQVRNRIEEAFVDLGQRDLKNILHPVRVIKTLPPEAQEANCP